MTLFRRVLTLLLLSAAVDASAQTGAPVHLRVILDTSQSMRTEDKAKLALLATSLLYDLARPGLGPDGSFEVITFHPTFKWIDKTAPPMLTGPRIQPGPANREREALQRQLFGLGYDALSTFFYPGMKAALDDFDRARGGVRARRVIVFVTDGKPDDPAESAFIDRDLRPRLTVNPNNPVQVYVLAFGSVTKAQDARDFFNSLVRSVTGQELGGLLTDETGDLMLTHMIDIFGRSFGYRSDALAMGRPLGLGNRPAERIAVVGMWSPSIGTSFAVASSSGASYNEPYGLMKAEHPAIGRSYALRWLLAPHQTGDGTLSNVASVGSASFVLMRPVVLNLDVVRRSGAAGGDIVAMAGQPIRDWLLRIREIDRDPCPVASCDLTVSYEVFVPNEGTPADARFSEDAFTRMAAVPPEDGNGATGGPGTWRDYDLQRVLVPVGATSRRTAYLGVKVARRNVVIAELPPENHPFTIYPYFQFAPTPAELDLARNGQRGPIGRSETGWCSDAFVFAPRGQPIEGSLQVRATLTAPLPPGLELRLDGIPLEDGSAAAASSAWSLGRPQTVDTLRAPHRVCASTGRNTAAGPLKVPIAFTVVGAPYDRLPVFERMLEINGQLSAPTFWDRFATLFILLLVALLALLCLLWLRFGLSLPPDLQVAHAGTDGTTAARLDEPSWFGRLQLWRERRPVYAANPPTLLGHLEPADTTLFRLRPVSAAVISRSEADAAADGSAKPASGDDLAVQQPYRLRSGASAHDVQVEYE